MRPIKKRGYYDCRISRPKRRGMNWTETSRARAISTLLKLMRLPQAKGKLGVIRFRERGQVGDVRTWHRLPLIFKVEPLKQTAA